MPTARSTTAPPTPGLTPLFDAAASRAADARATAEFGMPSSLLMERAGLESARAIMRHFPAVPRATILVGPGNNGGDGMVVARHLLEAGWAVDLVSTDGGAPTTPDAAVMAGIAERLGITVRAFSSRQRTHDGVLVDALLGTGTHGAPRAPMDAIVAWANRWPGPVVSLDVPTGVDADTGAVAGAAVTAALTLTYHADKPGLHVAPGRGHAGLVEVVDIGIPSQVTETPVAWLGHEAAATALPPKAPTGEKYGAGAVLVVAGAPGMTGAAVLASTAALRAGAGLVVAAVPESLRSEVAAHTVEVMCTGAHDRDGCLAIESVPHILRQSERVAAVAIGPGVGRAACTTEALRELLTRLRMPMVIDADGLLAPGRVHRPAVAAGRGHGDHPHAGEAARLLGWTRPRVEEQRLTAARTLAEDTGAVVVLKGPGTVVAHPDGTTVVARGGGATLSTAGSGDVLTGIVAAGLSKGMSGFTAAVAAVCLHAAAGDAAPGGDGTVARDLIAALPPTLVRLRAEPV
ncbi:MAG: NAD(P)H-hydrate epimerase [Thermoleophilia bacterium]